MKKIFISLFLTIVFCGVSLAQSSLPECEGNDNNMSKYTRKHFSLMRKWTNCHGTAMGPKGQKYIGEFMMEIFMDREPLDLKVENMLVNIKTTKDTARVLILTLMAINILENGKSISILEKEFIYIQMEINT